MKNHFICQTRQLITIKFKVLLKVFIIHSWDTNHKYNDNYSCEIRQLITIKFEILLKVFIIDF